MYADFIYPEYEVVRNYQRCIACRACERQCANEVHRYDADEQMMTADDAKCVNCHRCVSLCPTRALKIVRTDHTFKENANWTKDNIQNVYRQAATGGVLLSSMGNPEPLPGYWDRILINASQVTNPPIDPLREPMETRVFLGKKDMGEMLDYIDKLNELDTEGVEPMSHVFPVNNVFREDVVTNGDGSADTLANAPVKKDGGFKVPKTIS